MRAEPSCRHDLEVRVVATQDGGYYLYARDARGRVRERVVPDAISIGVLVASWIADDAVPIAPTTPAPVLAPPGASTSREAERIAVADLSSVGRLGFVSGGSDPIFIVDDPAFDIAVLAGVTARP